MRKKEGLEAALFEMFAALDMAEEMLPPKLRAAWEEGEIIFNLALANRHRELGRPLMDYEENAVSDEVFARYPLYFKAVGMISDLSDWIEGSWKRSVL